MVFVSLMEIHSVFLRVQTEAPTTVEHRHRRQTCKIVVIVSTISGHVPSLPGLDFLRADLEMISKRSTVLTE